jgi:hypothetical protein
VSATRLRYELPQGGRALFTTRSEGSFALAPQAAEGERARVRERALALTRTDTLARGRQVHGIAVRRVLSTPVEELPQEPADGQATAHRGPA